MSHLVKPTSDKDGTQVLQSAYNDVDSTLAINGFVASKVGNKIIRSDVSATIERYAFYDGTTLLYTLELTYDNGTHDNLNQVERIN